MTFLLLLIVIGVVFWATRLLISAFGIGEPVRSIVYVVVVVLSLLAIADYFGVMLPLLRR